MTAPLPCGASDSKMTVLNPRSRMISIRLSEEEYSALRRLCSVTGARSVSDLTRDAMRALLDGSERKDAAGSHVDEFRAEIRGMDRKIEQLASDIAHWLQVRSEKS